MERIKDGSIVPSTASGFIGRVTDNAKVGGKIGAGLSGAKTVTKAVEAAFTKMNGGERPGFLDTPLWEKMGPTVSALMVHATMVSPMGAMMPESVQRQVDPIIDYMEIGAFSEISEEVLTPIMLSVIEHFSSLPGEAMAAMKVVEGGAAPKKGKKASNGE